MWLGALSFVESAFVLWCSATDKPDLGGKEADDNRLLTEAEDSNMSVTVNAPGAYRLSAVYFEICFYFSC